MIMEELSSTEHNGTHLGYVVRDVKRSIHLVKEYFADSCNRGRLASALHDPSSIYDGILTKSIRTFGHYQNPFSFVFASTDIPRQVICERTGKDGDSFLDFSLEGLMPLTTDSSGRYRCCLPFVLSTTPAFPTQDNFRYFGIQISVNFYPSCYYAMTIEYDLGFFDIDLDPKNRVNYGGSRLRETLRLLLLNFKLFIPPYSYYRSQFHSKGRFTLDEEPEGSVYECIQAILDEMDSEG